MQTPSTEPAESAASGEPAARRRQARRAAMPPVTFPAALPVSQRKDDIAAAIRDHQVVVLAGETGSGKTTQLPKICLELGRGVDGMIGHTQPRRLAARSVSTRIAEELGSPLGEVVGYKVRFTDQSSDDTLIKVMTDGILLAEIQRDRMLRQYDTLIIDEAHERSLNIDFLLGYLHQLLPRRPDLKLVITSATIDPHRFARHFSDAPVVEVSGRTYPVEVRYRPLVEESAADGAGSTGSASPADDDVGDPADARNTDRDQTQGILDAVDELSAEGPGDILVFLSGEREIRDTAEALGRRKLRDTEILPLYARLSAAEQHRVFAAHPGRRVVLATNVAETSLTVPGIRYVVDPGSARISRYSHRLKVQRLPIEAVSQASANQRKGRCGRVADGICIRLYSEEDFGARPEFTDPEILRTNLASVILSMTSLGLGDVDAFGFLDPPDRRQVSDGVQLLTELGALNPNATKERRRLTSLGRRLATLPVDPRLGRMVLEADRNGCAREVLVIAAALSIQDPRERPADAREAADEQHRRFADDSSDFVAYLNLWSYLREQQKALSGSAFRRLCKREYLHYLRVREWQDLVAQLRRIAKDVGVRPNSTPAEPDDIHQSLLAGLLSHVGVKEGSTREYTGARNARFSVWPGSALARQPPQWVMAAELVETSRLWARDVARIQPEWAEKLGAHVVKRTYSEPHWSSKQGAAMAYERVTLYGVPVVTSRRVPYARVDPEAARDLFIRHALVEGDWRTHHEFFHRNAELRADAEELEHRVRRRDIVVDDDTLYAFYDAHVPSEVVSARHFDAWWKKARRDQPDLLTFDPAMLVSAEAEDVTAVAARDYPDCWQQGELRLPLTYEFEPGADADGVTVHIPLAVLNQVDEDAFAWQVPGLRHDLVTALIRSLPKAMRRSFVPAPDHAAAALREMTPYERPLLDALSAALHRLTGVAPAHDAWDVSRLPDHLRMTFRVSDEHERTLAEGKDLGVIRRGLAPQLAGTLAAAVGGVERTGLRSWDPEVLDSLPRTVSRSPSGPTAAAEVKGYPALVDEGDSVAVRVLGTEAEQRSAMWTGTRRLLLLTVPSPAKALLGTLTNAQKLALSHGPHANATALFNDCLDAAVDTLVHTHGGPAWDAAGFTALRDAVRGELHDTTKDVLGRVATILGKAREIEQRVRGMSSMALLPSLQDVKDQLGGLVYPGFVTATGRGRLRDVVRYLDAVARRLDVLAENPNRDRQGLHRVTTMAQQHASWLAGLPAARRQDDAVAEVRWMLEEFRVSVFAQTLGTPYPVSEKRIVAAMDRLDRQDRLDR